MSLTISELESERAKILEEIESKAQVFSTGSTMDPRDNHSLQDWLNAAEEVMPVPETEREKTKMRNPKSKSNYSTQMSPPSKNKASFFGVIIMLSLLLTLLGVLYIAYTSIHKEVQSIVKANEATVEQFKQMQLDMTELQKSLVTGGKPAAFLTLEDKVFALEAQVQALKLKSKAPIEGLITNKTPISTAPNNSLSLQDASHVAGSQLVTEAILDQKLKGYTEQLEQNIEHKLETILQVLIKHKSELPLTDLPMTNRTEKISESISEPSMPTITATKKPVIKQPLFKLVKKMAQPIAPKVKQVAEPLVDYTTDVKWLLTEPPVHYVLQLASMESKQSLEMMAHKKKLVDIKIVPQVRNGVTNYIMVTGSFSDRKQAEQLAKQIKKEFSISPWIRKFKDLSARVK